MAERFSRRFAVVPWSEDAIAQSAGQGIWQRDQNRSGYDRRKHKDRLENDPLQDHVQNNPNAKWRDDALEAGFQHVQLALAREQNPNEEGRLTLFGVSDSITNAKCHGYEGLQDKPAFARSGHSRLQAFNETPGIEIHKTSATEKVAISCQSYRDMGKVATVRTYRR